MFRALHSTEHWNKFYLIVLNNLLPVLNIGPNDFLIDLLDIDNWEFMKCTACSSKLKYIFFVSMTEYVLSVTSILLPLIFDCVLWDGVLHFRILNNISFYRRGLLKFVLLLILRGAALPDSILQTFPFPTILVCYFSECPKHIIYQFLCVVIQLANCLLNTHNSPSSNYSRLHKRIMTARATLS